jgi:hypothetical protein
MDKAKMAGSVVLGRIPLLCVDARYLAGRSLNLDGLETLEEHKEPRFHLYSVVW